MIKFIFSILFFLMLVACQKKELVFDSIANSNLELPLLLDFDKKSCAFDAQNNILKYTTDKKTLENFSAYIEFQPHSEVLFQSTKLSNNTVNHLGQLELNKAYTLIFKTAGEKREFKLLFTDIPIVQIVTLDPIINGPKTLSRLTLNYPEKKKKSDTDWAGIEQRGVSSLAYDKKSYGIGVFTNKSTDTPLQQSYFSLKPNQKWILDAMFVDLSKLRNRSSFDLWKSLSTSNSHIGITSKFVEVFLNNTSLGLYAFTENYTEDFLDLNDQSTFYKGTDNSLITSFYSLPNKAPISAKWADWEQKFPNPSQRIVWDDFEALSKLIVDGNDELFKSKIPQLIDLKNVIDYFLFINLCGGIDNVGKNWFFLKRDHSSKFILVPWDMDGTWGRSPFGEMVGHKNLITNRLFERLEETDPENYNTLLKQRWKVLRLKEFSQSNLMKLFSRNFDELKSYQIIGFENKLWGTNLNIENEEAYITNWIMERLAFLDKLFEY